MWLWGCLGPRWAMTGPIKATQIGSALTAPWYKRCFISHPFVFVTERMLPMCGLIKVQTLNIDWCIISVEQWPPVWLIPVVIYCHIWGVISLDNQEGWPASPRHAGSTPLFFFLVPPLILLGDIWVPMTKTSSSYCRNKRMWPDICFEYVYVCVCLPGNYQIN